MAYLSQTFFIWSIKEAHTRTHTSMTAIGDYATRCIAHKNQRGTPIDDCKCCYVNSTTSLLTVADESPVICMALRTRYEAVLYAHAEDD